MERMRGETEMKSGRDGIESHMHLRAGESSAAGHRDGSRSRLDDVRERAADLADRARERVSDTVGRAGQMYERRDELVSAVREHPFTAVGVAFSLGFGIAAATRGRRRHWVLERARRRLRAVLVSGITAALAHELRSIVGADEGLAGLVHSLFEGDEGELDELDDFEAEDEDGYPV